MVAVSDVERAKQFSERTIADPAGRPIRDRIMVSIDLSDFEFE